MAVAVTNEIPELTARVCKSGALVVVYLGGRLIGSWRRTRWLRRLVRYDVRTPAWTRGAAGRALAEKASA
jgi:hypothetical protein